MKRNRAAIGLSGPLCATALWLIAATSLTAQEPKRRTTFKEDKDGPVTALALSPDGKTLASGGTFLNVKLWEVATGKVKHMFKEVPQSNVRLAFSPDGKILATAGPGPNAGEIIIHLWDASNGNSIRTIKDMATFACIAFSPKEEILASGSNNGKVELWDVKTGNKLKTLGEHSDLVGAVVFSPDGKWLASAGAGNQIIVWDMATRQKKTTFQEPGAARVLALAFSPDNKTLASGSDLNVGMASMVRLWDVPGNKATELNEKFVRCHHLAFTSNGKTLIADPVDFSLILWDLTNGKKTAACKGKSGITATAVSKDGNTLSVARLDRSIEVWDMPAKASEK